MTTVSCHGALNVFEPTPIAFTAIDDISDDFYEVELPVFNRLLKYDAKHETEKSR